MSTIDEMIGKMCPDGVEYRRLGEVAEISTGKGITKKDMSEEGLYPIVSGGKEPMGFYHEKNRNGNTVTVARAGTAGYVSFMTQDFYLNDKCFSVIPKDESLHPKYLYYVLKKSEDMLTGMKSKGTVPTINTAKLGAFEIPIPLLAVQREVVRVLDTFTELTDELTTTLKAEDGARKQQYAWYRDDMLRLDGVERMKLEDICTIRNGYTPSKNKHEYWENGTVPWFRMDDIRTNGRELSESLQHVTLQAVKGQLFSADSIIFATTATIGEHALITVPFLCNQRFTVLTIRKELKGSIDIRYLFHYGFIIDEWCRHNTKSGTMAAVDMNKFRALEIPVPPLSIQQNIASRLDAFSSYCNDLTSGLPAEIEARRKQYAYYRDRLLSFQIKK